MSAIDFSVVVPVFNSEQSLVELYRGIRDVFSQNSSSFEVIFVDDGSSDGSWKVLQEIKGMDPERVTAVRLTRNFGQHNATFCGFGFAKGEAIITIDDDLQTPPEEIRTLVDCYRSSAYDIVYGCSGRMKNHSALRNLGSRSLKKSAHLFGRGPGEGSSFRLIRKEIISHLLEHQQHFLFIDEILQWYTDQIGFVQVRHQARKYNQSGYSNKSLLRLMGNIIIYYTTLPLKFLVYGGLIFSFITLAIGVYFIVKKIFFNVPLGYTSMIVAVLFSTSIILFSLGVIGEYISRIYLVQGKKPPFSVKKVM